MLNTSSVKVATTKRKAVEETILQKARKFVQKPKGDETEDTNAPANRLVKKPRHTTEEKLQSKLQKSKTTDSAQASSNSSKKKSKNKKRKKKKQTPKEKNPEQEVKRVNEALCYLKLWEKHRSQWKFEKLKQIWLLKNALKSSVIDDKNFEVLLDYVSSIKGHSRTTLITDMQNLIEDYESKFSSNNELNSDEKVVSDSDPSDFDKVKYERARKFVQMLSDD